MGKALRSLLPKMIPQVISWRVLVFQGKRDLLRHLPAQLKGYRSVKELKIVVLVDEDRQRCIELKGQLEDTAKDAGFITKSQSQGGNFQVLNRIVVEELEAWFFGDIQAIRQAYPKIPENLDKKKGYRDPDRIKGGTWEALHRILKRAGYYPSNFPKGLVAENISKFMDPARNRSHSFQVFQQGLY
jgi:hypothetical protein